MDAGLRSVNSLTVEPYFESSSSISSSDEETNAVLLQLKRKLFFVVIAGQMYPNQPIISTES